MKIAFHIRTPQMILYLFIFGPLKIYYTRNDWIHLNFMQPKSTCIGKQWKRSNKPIHKFANTPCSYFFLQLFNSPGRQGKHIEIWTHDKKIVPSGSAGAFTVTSNGSDMSPKQLIANIQAIFSCRATLQTTLSVCLTVRLSQISPQIVVPNFCPRFLNKALQLLLDSGLFAFVQPQS